MSMKLVSFEVAKAIKAAGYPQDYIETWYYGDNKIHHIDDPYVESTTRLFRAPTYFEVWLWLWKEKKIYIDIVSDKFGVEVSVWDNNMEKIYEDIKHYSDPEEAIVAAIEYLVENNLLK